MANAWFSIYQQTPEEIRNDINHSPLRSNLALADIMFSNHASTGSVYGNGVTQAILRFMQYSFGSNKIGLVEPGDKDLEGVIVPQGKTPWYATYHDRKTLSKLCDDKYVLVHYLAPKTLIIFTDKDGRNPVFAQTGKALPVEWLKNAREDYVQNASNAFLHDEEY